jgi:hypothetical protein
MAQISAPLRLHRCPPRARRRTPVDDAWPGRGDHARAELLPCLHAPRPLPTQTSELFIRPPPPCSLSLATPWLSPSPLQSRTASAMAAAMGAPRPPLFHCPKPPQLRPRTPPSLPLPPLSPGVIRPSHRPPERRRHRHGHRRAASAVAEQLPTVSRRSSATLGCEMAPWCSCRPQPPPLVTPSPEPRRPAASGRARSRPLP